MNQHIKLAAFGFFIAMSTGCATTAPPPAEPIQVNENYQALYKRLAQQARNCMPMQFIGASNQFVSELYPELNSAEISVRMQGMVGSMHLLSIDIKKIDTTQSIVEIAGKGGYLKNAKHWLASADGSCRS